MLKQQKIFFDFLRFCIGSTKEIPGSLKEVDWKELYAIAQKQALLGVLFHGIQRLPKELAPEQKLLMQWMVMAEQIRKRKNKLSILFDHPQKKKERSYDIGTWNLYRIIYG